jgi:hypothetical protein
MTDLQKTAQQALEALESSRIFVTTREKTKHPEGTEWYDSAITALREALDQPEQEPTCPECKAVVLYECVACSNNNYPPRPEQQAEQCIGKDPRCPCQDGDACHYKDCGDTKALPVPAQEPVATLFGTLPVYDTPPAAQRPWVGLTDDDMKDPKTRNFDFIYGARWAEARLKERNT